MTIEEFANARPDLLVNWERSHDPAWLNGGHGDKATTDAIAAFGSLEAYLEASYGAPFDPSPAPPPVVIAPAAPVPVLPANGALTITGPAPSSEDFPTVEIDPDYVPPDDAPVLIDVNDYSNWSPPNQPQTLTEIVSGQPQGITIAPTIPISLPASLQPSSASIPIVISTEVSPVITAPMIPQTPTIPAAPIEIVPAPSPINPAGQNTSAATGLPPTFLDNISRPDQSAFMSGTAPTARISVPANVFEGEGFRIELVEMDPDKDIGGLIVRDDLGNVLADYNLSDTGNSDARGAYVDVPGQGHGVFRFQVETYDLHGNRSTSPWQSVNVLTQTLPASDAISTWVRVKRVPTSSPGVFNNILEVDPNAPALVIQAVTQATPQDWVPTPEQLYAGILSAYTRLAADAAAAGSVITALPTNTATGSATSTIVAYDNGNPVIQEVTSSGSVIQYTQTGTGNTTPVVVPDLGTYVPTSTAGDSVIVTTPTPVPDPANVTGAGAQTTIMIPTPDQLVASLPSSTVSGFNPKAYAGTRPDLVINWQRTLDPAWAQDPNVPGIASYGTLAAYLEANYRADHPAGTNNTPAPTQSAGSGVGSLLIIGGAIAVAVWAARRSAKS